MTTVHPFLNLTSTEIALRAIMHLTTCGEKFADHEYVKQYLDNVIEDAQHCAEERMRANLTAVLVDGDFIKQGE